MLFEIHARAPVAGLAAGATIASSRVGSMMAAVAVVVRRRPRIVVCMCALARQVSPARLPARHVRRATWRQPRVRWARLWRRWRRLRARRRCSPRAVVWHMFACMSVHVGRGYTFLRHSRTPNECTFHLYTRGCHLAAHRHARRVTARGRRWHARVRRPQDMGTKRRAARPARHGRCRRHAARLPRVLWRPPITSACTMAPHSPPETTTN